MSVKFFDLMIPGDEHKAIARIGRIAHSVRMARDADRENLPQIAKLWRIYGDNHLVQDFLEWLQSKEFTLCRWVASEDGWPAGYRAITESERTLMAEYFDFDYEAHDQELRWLIEEMRAASEQDGDK